MAPCTALASECRRHSPVTLHIAPVACGPPRPTRTCGHGPYSRWSVPALLETVVDYAERTADDGQAANPI
eukprot:4707426-Lingulodinium_polyedra.AAC.1